jgi:hypothetical protein
MGTNANTAIFIGGNSGGQLFGGTAGGATLALEEFI